MRFDDIKWESKPCRVGNSCWCRMLFTVTGEEVLHEGAIDKELAEYIVSLHNSHLTMPSTADCQCSWDYVTGESPNYFCGKCGKPMRR